MASARLAFAALCIVAGVLTLAPARAQEVAQDAVHDATQDAVHPVSVPAVERTSWFSWHTNPNNLPTALANSLIRWHVHDAFSSYWLGYAVAFLAQGRVTVSPAGPDFIRYPPYYEAIAASPAPAWIFVSSAGEREAGIEAGTPELNPGCILHGPPCLLAPDLVHWCALHHISYEIRYSGPYIVVLPARRVLPTQVLPFFGI